MDISSYLKESARVLEETASHIGSERIDAAIELLAGAIAGRRVVLVCGNGGSASDAMHITGELVGRFLKERRAFKAICLSSNTAARWPARSGTSPASMRPMRLRKIRSCG